MAHKSMLASFAECRLTNTWTHENEHLDSLRCLWQEKKVSPSDEKRGVVSALKRVGQRLDDFGENAAAKPHNTYQRAMFV